jgi:hypothetical protein
MPRRVVFRDAAGRFARAVDISEQMAGTVEIFDPSTGERSILSAEAYFTPPEEATEAPGPSWQQTETERGIIWDDFDSEATDLEGFGPPDGVDAYRVFVNVEGNPDYPRGMASTGWIDASVWPPSLDMIRGVDASSFNQIRFRRS